MIRRKGFTLIELLVVVAIMALLMAILMPSLARAKAQARQAACGSNLRQIMMGVNMYAEGNNNRLPEQKLPLSAPAPYTYRDWSAEIVATMSNRDISEIASLTSGGITGNGASKVFRCPEDMTPRRNGETAPYRSYANNSSKWLSDAMRDVKGYASPWPRYDGSWAPLARDGRPAKLIQIPQFVMLFGEGWDSTVTQLQADYVGIAEGEGLDSFVSKAHNNGGNYAFGDSHVEWRSYKEVTKFSLDTDYNGNPSDFWKWKPGSL